MTTPSDARAHWSTKLAFVFPSLQRSSTFPPLAKPVVGDHDRVLRRYVQQANDLAASEVLNAGDVGMKINLGEGGTVESVEGNFSTPERVRGLTAGFRQLYSPNEPASFQKAIDTMQLAVRAQSSADESSQLAALAEWGAAARALRGNWLDALAQARIAPDLRTAVPKESPEEVISVFFYGEHLHWDRKADRRAEWAEDPLFDAYYQLHFLGAVAGLGWLYVEFAELIVTANGW